MSETKEIRWSELFAYFCLAQACALAIGWIAVDAFFWWWLRVMFWCSAAMVAAGLVGKAMIAMLKAREAPHGK